MGRSSFLFTLSVEEEVEKKQLCPGKEGKREERGGGSLARKLLFHLFLQTRHGWGNAEAQRERKRKGA